MNVEAKGLDYKALNEAIRAAGPSCRITRLSWASALSAQA